MTIRSDGDGIWKTNISYREAAKASLPIIGIGISLIKLGKDLDDRIWNLPGTEERLRLLKRQCVHGACGLVSSLLTLALTVALVSAGIFTGNFVEWAYSLSIGSGLTFFAFTDWPPFNHTASSENQARENQLALENRMQGH